MSNKKIAPDFRWFRSESLFMAIDRGSTTTIEGNNRPALHEMTRMPRITASLRLLEGANRMIFLTIPFDELENVPPVPEQWQSLVDLKFHAFKYNPCFESAVLTEEENSKLVPGAMFLMNNSFELNWPVSMTAQPEAPELASSFTQLSKGYFDQESFSIRLQPAARKPADGEISTDEKTLFLLDESLVINQLYAKSIWQSGKNLVLKLSQALENSRVRIIQSSESKQSKVEMFGTFIRVGKGFGVLIDGEGC